MSMDEVLPPSSASASDASCANARDDDDATDVVFNITHHQYHADADAAVRDGKVSAMSSAAVPAHGLFANLRKFFNPRATDIHQLLVKLQTQFRLLDVEHKKYMLSRTRSSKRESSFHFLMNPLILLIYRKKHFLSSFFERMGWPQSHSNNFRNLVRRWHHEGSKTSNEQPQAHNRSAFRRAERRRCVHNRTLYSTNESWQIWIHYWIVVKQQPHIRRWCIGYCIVSPITDLCIDRAVDGR